MGGSALLARGRTRTFLFNLLYTIGELRDSERSTLTWLDAAAGSFGRANTDGRAPGRHQKGVP
jgi:hypothetical protein